MVGQRKRSKKQLGNHQKCWLWGRHAVLESLRGGRWIPLEIYLDDEALTDDVLAEVEELAETHSLDLFNEDAARISQLCGAKDHQGLMAKMPEYPYVSLETLLQPTEKPPLFLILDRLQDPYNFGSMIRSAEQFGVNGIMIGQHAQAGVSVHVARSSAGAVNHINICRVESLAQSLSELKTIGVRLFAASEKADKSLTNANFKDATAILIGNEGEGIAPEILNVCDELISIPQAGHVDSLNAAVAAGIFCYEVQRQRQ